MNEGLFGKLEKNGRLWESRSETVEGCWKDTREAVGRRLERRQFSGAAGA